MEMLISLHNAVPKAVGAFCQEFWLKDGNEVKIQQNFSINKSKHPLWFFFFISNGQGTWDETFPSFVTKFVPYNLFLQEQESFRQIFQRENTKFISFNQNIWFHTYKIKDLWGDKLHLQQGFSHGIKN